MRLLATNEGYVETEIGMEIATDVLAWLIGRYVTILPPHCYCATNCAVACFAASNLIK